MLAIVALLAEIVITQCFSQYDFEGHWVVPVYFIIFYVVASLFAVPGMTSIEFTRCFIGFKATKIFCSMLFIMVSAFLMRENILAVVCIFFVYYLLLLIPECAYSIYMKKHLK